MFWAVCPSVCVHAIYMHTLASLEALTDQLAIVVSGVTVLRHCAFVLLRRK